jgi:hypothetical protein
VRQPYTVLSSFVPPIKYRQAVVAGSSHRIRPHFETALLLLKHEAK